MVNATSTGNAGSFKKSFTKLKAYINLFRGHVQRFELSLYSTAHRVLPVIVTVQCNFH
jgi:hemerythrin-like domain-containing protein